MLRSGAMAHLRSQIVLLLHLMSHLRLQQQMLLGLLRLLLFSRHLEARLQTRGTASWVLVLNLRLGGFLNHSVHRLRLEAIGLSQSSVVARRLRVDRVL